MGNSKVEGNCFDAGKWSGAAGRPGLHVICASMDASGCPNRPQCEDLR